MKRYPTAPYFAALAREWPGKSDRFISEALGKNPEYIANLRQREHVGLWRADRLATGLGYYPSAIWPEWDDDAAALIDEGPRPTCGNPGTKGYWAHKRAGETPCAACQAEYRTYHAEYKRARRAAANQAQAS